MIEVNEYCSPELLNHTITDFRTNDVWAFGCIIYAFYHGKTPFINYEIHQMISNIKNANCEYDLLLPTEVKDLLKKIFVVNPKKRLGCRSDYIGIKEIKSHSYFKGIDWNNLTNTDVPFSGNQLGSSLLSTDRRVTLWKNMCKEINNNHDDEYTIHNILPYSSMTEYFFDKILLKDKRNFNNEPKMIYEGIVSTPGLMKTTFKLKLFSNKQLLVLNVKDEQIVKEINLTKASISFNSGKIKINNGIHNFSFKVKNSDWHLLYQYINIFINSKQ